MPTGCTSCPRVGALGGASSITIPRKNGTQLAVCRRCFDAMRFPPCTQRGCGETTAKDGCDKSALLFPPPGFTPAARAMKGRGSILSEEVCRQG